MGQFHSSWQVNLCVIQWMEEIHSFLWPKFSLAAQYLVQSHFPFFSHTQSRRTLKSCLSQAISLLIYICWFVCLCNEIISLCLSLCCAFILAG